MIIRIFKIIINKIRSPKKINIAAEVQVEMVKMKIENMLKR